MRPFDGAPLVDGFWAQAGKGDHRSSPPFGAKQGKVLDTKTRQESAPAEYSTGDLGALSAAAVKSNFNHLLSPRAQIGLGRKMGAIEY
jgi:hypothetical protein